MKLEDQRLTNESIEEEKKKRSQDESIKKESQDVGETSVGNRFVSSPDVSLDSNSDDDSDTTVTVKHKPACIPSTCSANQSSQSSHASALSLTNDESCAMILKKVSQQIANLTAIIEERFANKATQPELPTTIKAAPNSKTECILTSEEMLTLESVDNNGIDLVRLFPTNCTIGKYARAIAEQLWTKEELMHGRLGLQSRETYRVPLGGPSQEIFFKACRIRFRGDSEMVEIARVKVNQYGADLLKKKRSSLKQSSLVRA
jgi:hypothetical protein